MNDSAPVSAAAGGDQLAARLEQLDISLFEPVSSQTTVEDRRSLLAVQRACRETLGDFRYLEIGSHLGGSLQVLVRDPRCTAIVSIDSRPPSQPDPFWGVFEYPDNSTERMIEHLREVPDADLGKLVTIDASTETLSPADVPVVPQVCLIDGEHTNVAAARDARFCARLLDGRGLILFHDCHLVNRAIAGFLAETARSGVRVTAYPLPELLFAVELGPPRISGHTAIRARLAEGALRAWPLVSRLPLAHAALDPMLRVHSARVSAKQRRDRRELAERLAHE